MLRVGLTGGLASGKSTVAGYLRELGAEVIEADELGRALMEPGQQCFCRNCARVRPGGGQVRWPPKPGAAGAKWRFRTTGSNELNAHCSSRGHRRAAGLDGRGFCARSSRRSRGRVGADL